MGIGITLASRRGDTEGFATDEEVADFELFLPEELNVVDPLPSYALRSGCRRCSSLAAGQASVWSCWGKELDGTELEDGGGYGAEWK